MPQISVIVPIYKVEKYIHRCVDSILRQTFEDFELVLVDDGSPDNCGAICDEYAAKDSRVVVIHQENGGLSAARNAGIDWAFTNSDSQWLSFIDSDDWVHPQFLELLYESVKSNGLLISCGEFQLVRDGESMKTADSFSTCIQTPEEVYQSPEGWGVQAYVWRFLFHRSLLSNVRFPKGKTWEDVYTTPQLIFQVQEIARIKEPLYYYCIRSDSITQSDWAPYKLDAIEAMEFNLCYLEKRVSDDFYHNIVLGYFSSIYVHWQKLIAGDVINKDRETYIKHLKKKMRQGLVRYGIKANISIEQYSWFYEMVFPRSVNSYWIITSQWKKLKKYLGCDRKHKQ